MAYRAITTSIATSSTAVVLPTRRSGSGASNQAEWSRVAFKNIGTTTTWLTQASGTAVAEAEENIPLLSGETIEMPYNATAGIAITSANKIVAIGVLDSPGSVR